MPSATVRIEVGKAAALYAKAIGKGGDYGGSTVSVRAEGNALVARVDADNPASLVASVSGVVKKLRVVIGVDESLVDAQKSPRSGTAGGKQ